MNAYSLSTPLGLRDGQAELDNAPPIPSTATPDQSAAEAAAFCSQTEAKDALMEEILVNELQPPSELAKSLERLRQQLGFFSRKEVAQFYEDALLRFHFGGMNVVCRRTRKGLSVIAFGEPQEVAHQIDALPAAQRKDLVFMFPPLWEGTPRVSKCLTQGPSV